MEKEQILKQIMDLEVEFANEMMAEGAWCGHTYATSYFSNLKERVIKLIDVCLEQYKDCSVFEYPLHAAHFKLSVDYDMLIDRVYKLDWADRENSIYIIADALNDTFKDKLSDAMGDLAEFYSRLSGRLFNDDFDLEMYG